MAKPPTTEIAVRPPVQPPTLRDTPAGKAVVWSASKWWQHRLRLVPVNTAAAAIASAGLVHYAPPEVAGWSLAATTAVAAGGAVWHRVWRRRDGRALNGTQSAYVAASGLSLLGYETASTAMDPYTAPMMWTWGTLATAASLCWWMRGSAIPEPEKEEAAEPETAKERAVAPPAPAEIWVKRIGCAGGPIPASILKDVEPLAAADGTDNGQTGIIVLNSDGGAVKHTPSDVAPQLLKIATAFKMDPSNVAVEPWTPNEVRLLMFRRNPLTDTVIWPGPGKPGTYTHPAGKTPTGKWAEQQLFAPGWGALHELGVGSTGSGKSRTARLRLAMARHTCDANNDPVVASWLLDPHQGSSFAGWRDRVDVFARNDEQILIAIAALIAEKDRRLGILATSRREVLRPSPDTPLINAVLDESHGFFTRNPQAGPLVSQLVGEGRKVLIRINAYTLYPVMEKLGGDVSIRDGLLTTATIHRTGNAYSGMIVANGKQIGDPGALPRLWPDGTSAAGVAYLLGGTADHSVMIRGAVGGEAVEDDSDDAPLFDEAWFMDGITVRTEAGLLVAAEYDRPPHNDDATAAEDDVGTEPDPARPWAQVLANATPAPGMSTFAKARMFLTELGAPASTGQIAAGIGEKLNTVSQAMSRGVERGDAVDLEEHGMWCLPEHAGLVTAGAAR